MGKYRQMPMDTFNRLQMDSGIICANFDPETGSFSDIIGATTGGVQIDATPSFSDLGEDVDNCPKNMMELKKLESWECKISGTYLTTSASSMKNLLGAASVSNSRVTLNNSLSAEDFKTLWFVGDYGESGFLAVKLSNALNTSGLSLKTEKDSKGQISFEYLGHYSMDSQNTVPLEIYIVDNTKFFAIKYDLTNAITKIAPEQVAENADLLSQYTAKAGYVLPESIEVTVGDSLLSEDSDYTWDASTGVLYIKSERTTGDITISINGVTAG